MAEVERDERDGLDAGAARRLHQELNCNGTRSGRAPKPAAQALAYQGGTSRPARNAQPGQLEAGEEPASEDLRGASSAEEDEAEEEGARIPIDCLGNRAFYVKGTFIASNGHRCEGCVEEEGSPPMSLRAWTIKCNGSKVRAERVMVVDADGQTTRCLRDVLDDLSASEDEEEGARIPIDYRGNRAFYVEGTFIASNGTRCEGFVEEKGSPPMSFSAWTKKCTGNRLALSTRVSTRDVMVVDADGQTKRSLRDVLDGVSGSEDEDPTSQYRGVTWNKKQKQWQVQMGAHKVGKPSIFLGLFDYEDEEDAARMYDRGQIAYLGRDEASTHFPLAEYSHELDWLEGLGVIDFAARLKAARKKLKKAKKPSTSEAVLQEAGLPSVPGPQQQHGATPMEVKDEEIEIRKLAREGTPPPPLRPAAGQASRPKRSRPAARGDSKAAKRQKPAQVPPQAAAIAELRQAQAQEAQRRDLREAELKEQNEVLLAKVDGLAAKSAQQERLIKHLEQYNAHLERFKAHVLEENEELRGLLLAKEG